MISRSSLAGAAGRRPAIYGGSPKPPSDPPPVQESVEDPEALPSQEELLDESLAETFPASDPISPASPPRRDKSPKSAASTEPRVREERIRVAAYYRAQARGFVWGKEVDDWLAAEAAEDTCPAAAALQ